MVITINYGFQCVFVFVFVFAASSKAGEESGGDYLLFFQMRRFSTVFSTPGSDFLLIRQYSHHFIILARSNKGETEAIAEDQLCPFWKIRGGDRDALLK